MFQIQCWLLRIQRRNEKLFVCNEQELGKKEKRKLENVGIDSFCPK